jgi:hypothetical protein
MNKDSLLTENLKKALTTIGASDGALLPYDLEPVLEEELLALQPLAELIPILSAGSKTHEYNVRTSHPMGWFEGETTPPNYRKGGYARKSVQLKIARNWGQVTGFAQEMDERFVDALATEIENSLMGMADVLEYGALFGCATDLSKFTGDEYQFSGILPYVFQYAPENVIDAGGDKVALDDLDQLIAKVRKYRQTRNDPGTWFMGLRMKQVVDGLQSKVQLPLQSVELADGKIVMAAYDGAPILETEYTVPGTTSPTVTSALAAGGSFADALDLTHRISSITAFGECIGGTAGTQRTTGSGNNTVDLSWTADANAKLYMIWRQVGTGDFQLIDIIPALTYDSEGTVNGSVESYSDDGTQNAVTQVMPLESGEQQIAYANRNPNRGAAFMSKVDDMGRELVNSIQYVELARVKDTYDFMLKSYLCLRMKYPNLFGVIRHVKLA